MSTNGLSESRIQVIRLICFLFATSSFVLYGGAIMGEGAMFALGAIWPVRYLVFFQYLVVYKTFACLAGTAVLLRMDSAPIGAWLVIGGWAFAGLISAIVFPWGKWPSVESWYGAAE
ncbi:MAG: hypothetical protein JRD92_19240 [Deltaproteobacteria bacterium]|nr:hypothetical protein [Deltaproteobacteria bacterium]